MPHEDDSELATRRLRLIADQIGEELGPGHGMKTRAAKKMGISESAFSKIVHRQRKAGWTTINRVTKALGLDLSFFTDPSLGPSPHYRDHALRRGSENRRDELPPHWQEFLAHYPRIRQLSEADLVRLRGMFAPNVEITSWTSWAQLADWLLDRRREP